MELQTTQNAIHQPDGILTPIKCPHCGMIWAWTLKRWEKKVITCPSDEGGCDTDFVAELDRIEVAINVYELA